MQLILLYDLCKFNSPSSCIFGWCDLYWVATYSPETTVSAFFLPCVLVCGSLYEVLTGLPESEMPDHFYMDQRFALVLLCLFFILPLSVPKEISIQKYIRLAPRSACAPPLCTICFTSHILLYQCICRALYQPTWFLWTEFVLCAGKTYREKKNPHTQPDCWPVFAGDVLFG